MAKKKKVAAKKKVIARAAPKKTKKRAVAPKKKKAAAKPAKRAVVRKPKRVRDTSEEPTDPIIPSLEKLLASPVPAAWLADEAGRELAYDSLAAWVVSTLQAAQDDAAANETLRMAIKTFYDIRSAANEPRGEDAARFFIVDAVGRAASHRPVPWQVLAETVSQERLSRFSAIFEAAEHDVG